MQNKRKPLVVLIMAVFVLATVLSGCSGKKGEGGNNTSSPPPTSTNTATPGNTDQNKEDEPWVFGSEMLEFSAYAHYGWLDFPLEMDEVPFWKYLKANKNVNIKTIQAQGNHAQLMTTMMGSNTLPDLIYMDRYHPDFDRMYNAGKLVAFDDYLDKYPNLKKWMNAQDMELLRSPDGKLYKFPNWYSTKPTGNAGYVVNKKIYEELGSPKLETTDDLYNYLVKVKEKYGSEVVPFEPDRTQDAQGIGVLYTAFGEDLMYKSLSADVLGVVDGDKLTSLFTSGPFRESQKFVSKLYREKLISQEMFTQDRGMVLEKLLTGRVAVYAGSSPTAYASQAHYELLKDDPNSGYFMIWPIRKEGLDKNKIHPGGYDTLGWNVSVITTSAKDPEKIFAFLDYCTSPEGMTVQFFGEEGKYWNGFDENGYPNFTDAYDIADVADIQAKNDVVTIAGNVDYIDPAKMKFENSQPVEKQNWQARYQNEITWPSANDITVFNNRMNPEADSTLGDIRQSMLDLFMQVLADSSTAKSDEEVDKILDKAEADAKKLGYDDLLEWRTQIMNENKKILGVR
ncbi:extracellular solute-binding protein [Paenibacillus sp. GXUN7292]|uniref:extracellular solute-binding protein n=1 Tax=Paenibacillus sp. GXUN7292 TaxID=3422499 RepID=UPI003D7C6FD6